MRQRVYRVLSQMILLFLTITAATAEPTPPTVEPLAELAVPPSPVGTPKPPRTLTITLGGDLGLGAHGAAVDADNARRHGRSLPWADLTDGIRPLLDGDLNFANLETVVTARNDLSPSDKTFTFRSHPDGVRHLARIGFNILSTANNHAIDYGIAGLAETMRNLDRLKSEGALLAHAGVGQNRDMASLPQAITVRGWRVAFSALGIDSGGRAGADRPGQMAWRAPEDVAEVIQRLSDAPADFRILSVHHGRERDVTTDRDAIRKLRHQAVLAGGVDLVVGHHAHVAQGIELTGGRLIFYGLGNLLHPGMQDMGAFGNCQDYGLMARVHLAEDANGRLALRAVEAIPLTDMHWQARPMSGEAARVRIHVLNHLASALDDNDSGARGLRFAPTADGTGLYCAPEAANEPGRIGALCRDWTGVPAAEPSLAARVRSACGSGAIVARARGESRPSSSFQASRLAVSRPAAAANSDRRWVGSIFAGN